MTVGERRVMKNQSLTQGPTCPIPTSMAHPLRLYLVHLSLSTIHNLQWDDKSEGNKMRTIIPQEDGKVRHTAFLKTESLLVRDTRMWTDQFLQKQRKNQNSHGSISVSLSSLPMVTMVTQGILHLSPIPHSILRIRTKGRKMTDIRYVLELIVLFWNCWIVVHAMDTLVHDRIVTVDFCFTICCRLAELYRMFFYIANQSFDITFVNTFLHYQR